MLNRIVLFAFFLLPFTATFSQSDITGFTSNFETVLPAHFVGGIDGFLRHFFEKVKYPADARLNCRSGQLLIKVTVSPKGEVQAVAFLNQLGYGIEEEVESVLKASDGKWNPSSEGAVLFFTIGFELEDVAKIKGDMKINAYGSGAHGDGCETTKVIEKQLDKAIMKGKKGKAMAYCEELLRRYPFSAEYTQMYNKVKDME